MFKKLVSVDEAQRILAKNYVPKPVGTEVVPLSESYGRVLAKDVVAPFDIPPFDRSTVDGYAMKAEDTFGAMEAHALKLKLIGRVNIGAAPKVKIQKGTLAEIVTGAPIPDGANAVVMVEYTERRDDFVLVRQAVSVGENIMKAGSDIHKRESVAIKGTVLSPYQVGVLAAVGCAKAEVYKRPSVAVFSTGAEIVQPGQALKPGKIFDINAHALSAAVLDCGGQPINMGIVQDEPEEMQTALCKALETADAVITSGGVSVGPTDIIPKVLNTLGKPGVIVYGIAVRPGKPTAIALVNGKPVFSLPGHPTSSLMIFYLFVQRVLLHMAGREEEPSLVLKAKMSERLFPSRGRRTYVTVTLKKNRSGELIASPVPTGLSGAITTLSKADGFTIIHETQQFVDKGATVNVELFKPSTRYFLMRGESK